MILNSRVLRKVSKVDIKLLTVQCGLMLGKSKFPDESNYCLSIST